MTEDRGQKQRTDPPSLLELWRGTRFMANDGLFKEYQFYFVVHYNVSFYTTPLELVF